MQSASKSAALASSQSASDALEELYYAYDQYKTPAATRQPVRLAQEGVLCQELQSRDAEHAEQ